MDGGGDGGGDWGAMPGGVDGGEMPPGPGAGYWLFWFIAAGLIFFGACGTLVTGTWVGVPMIVLGLPFIVFGFSERHKGTRPW